MKKISYHPTTMTSEEMKEQCKENLRELRQAYINKQGLKYFVSEEMYNDPFLELLERKILES